MEAGEAELGNILKEEDRDLVADWLQRERRLGCLEVLCPEIGGGAGVCFVAGWLHLECLEGTNVGGHLHLELGKSALGC